MSEQQPSRPPRVVRLPGFVREEVGLGDAIKRATAAVGIKPCAPCAQRAARLNQRIVLAPRERP
jgi:hypothetical protein